METWTEQWEEKDQLKTTIKTNCFFFVLSSSSADVFVLTVVVVVLVVVEQVYRGDVVP